MELARKICKMSLSMYSTNIAIIIVIMSFVQYSRKDACRERLTTVTQSEC